MLASITPLGERSRGFTWRATASAFAVGAIAAGATVGVLLGALGSGLALGDGARGWAAVAVLAVAVALDLPAGRRWLPTSRRQVNEDWLGRYRGWVYGVGFGAQLGAGAATIVTTAAVYATAALALLSGGAAGGALIGGAFGLLRAMALLAARRVHDPASLGSLHRQLASLEGPVAAAVPAVEALVLLVLVATTIGAGA
jgi:sulfite exporter TauE/SafE